MDTREETHNQPRPVSYEVRMQVDELRRLEYDFIDLCNRIGKSRELALAVTNMEQASMWAVRHLMGSD
jgi:hypothetical protein